LIHCKKDYRPEPYGVRNSTIKGYAYTKEFYNPKYDGTILPDTKDYRRTLYWNPDVKTDRNGEATVVFYNNSSSSDIKIDAETVTNKGIIGALNQ
jgi:uncharacterized protein YfaS (alpha-2-macroglobulin family)